MELDELKKEYEKLGRKYKLPSFSALNEDFEIDKIDRETDCLLRLIRKIVMEKIVNSISFLDMILNPINAPRIYMGYLKSLNGDDKVKIDKIYDALSELSLYSLDLEIDYSEKDEAELIAKICRVWNSMKPNFRAILTSMKRPAVPSNKKEKSYFG